MKPPAKPYRRRPSDGRGILAELARAVERAGPYPLAQKAGVAHQIVFRFLSGERSLSGPSIDRLAAALGGRLTFPAAAAAKKARAADPWQPAVDICTDMLAATLKHPTKEPADDGQ